MINRELGKKLCAYLKDKEDGKSLYLGLLTELKYYEVSWISALDVKFCDALKYNIEINEQFLISVAQKMYDSYDYILDNELYQAVEDTIEEMKQNESKS